MPNPEQGIVSKINHRPEIMFQSAGRARDRRDGRG
jgi:hypothetical protein